jgi:hypothetical protein
MRFSFKTGRWYPLKGGVGHELRESCAHCGRPFLSQPKNPGVCCSRQCAVGELNSCWKGGVSLEEGYQEQWRVDNPNYMSQWRRDHRDKCNQYGADRRARLLHQTPADASAEKIGWFFKVSAYLQESSGMPYHVDHIHPLSEEGPHHEDNLQVLPGVENLKKRAKVGVEPTGITIETYYALMSAFDFLASLACPEQ